MNAIISVARDVDATHFQESILLNTVAIMSWMTSGLGAVIKPCW